LTRAGACDTLHGMSKSALGRGLGALLGGGQPSKPAVPKPIANVSLMPTPLAAAEHGATRKVAITRIHPSVLQPRKDFTPEALQELADSIRSQGVIQPLVVRPKGGDFELIAGERRWRASQLAGLTEVPVVVREANDAAVLEMMLIENLQRENLNPIEEAQGYQQLIAQFDLSQEQAAVKVGRNRATVANALRLLKLPEVVREFIRKGEISAGHAKVILGLEMPDDQLLAAEETIRNGLSVRALEDWLERLKNLSADVSKAAKPVHLKEPLDANASDLQVRLQQRFGARVGLRYRKGKGAITIHFMNNEDLERILEICSVKVD
jgi:ParB family transcriptional regulator, chromosome partitioning protein